MHKIIKYYFKAKQNSAVNIDNMYDTYKFFKNLMDKNQ